MFDSMFCTKIRFNMYWKSLTYKNEYKIESNEFALFQALADEVGIIALNIGLDHNLCEALARCSGFAFIDNGIAAWNAIKEYLELNNIDLDINENEKIVIIGPSGSGFLWFGSDRSQHYSNYD